MSDICATCGHGRRAHIYEEGACRPGFACPHRCEEFRYAPAEKAATSWRCRRGWHGRGQVGLHGLANLCFVHRCPRCGAEWLERVTP